MTDQALINTTENVKGVFADLDDGGLTESEALEQIRGIVSAKKPITRMVLTGSLPFTITVDLAGYDGPGSVSELEIDYTFATFNEQAETRAAGETLDPVVYANEIEEARRIASETGNWPDPERM